MGLRRGRRHRPPDGGSPTGAIDGHSCFPAKMPDTTSSEGRVPTAPVVADGVPVSRRAAERHLQAPPHERGGPRPLAPPAGPHTQATSPERPSDGSFQHTGCYHAWPAVYGAFLEERKLREGRPHFLGQHSLGQSISTPGISFLKDASSFSANCPRESKCACCRSGTRPL